MTTVDMDWHAAYVNARNDRHELLERLIVVEQELDDARREYRRSDTVIGIVQSWLARPEASREELVSRLEALGVGLTE